MSESTNLRKEMMERFHSLPIDVINLIYEFAVGHDEIWYPMVSPKTHKVRWRVNKHCTSFLKRNPLLCNTRVLEGNVLLENHKLFTRFTGTHRTIIHEYVNGTSALYIEFDSETEQDKMDKYVYRSWVQVINTDEGFYSMPNKHQSELYLNHILYGFIHWVSFEYDYRNLLKIVCENY